MKKMNVITVFLAVIALAGCSGAKEQLGLARKAPDEFAVVKRAPLAMPPDYSLRPPQPGAPRPQEQHSEEQAREVVFGSESQGSAKPGSGESALLQRTGADQADPSIRSVVDRETAAMAPKEKPVAQKLLGVAIGGDQKPPASVVDPKAEAERLKKNAAEGKPVTEGKTPSVDE